MKKLIYIVVFSILAVNLFAENFVYDLSIHAMQADSVSFYGVNKQPFENPTWDIGYKVKDLQMNINHTFSFILGTYKATPTNNVTITVTGSNLILPAGITTVNTTLYTATSQVDSGTQVGNVPVTTGTTDATLATNETPVTLKNAEGTDTSTNVYLYTPGDYYLNYYKLKFEINATPTATGSIGGYIVVTATTS